MGNVIPIRPDVVIRPAGQTDTGVSPWIVVGVVFAGLAAWEVVRYVSQPPPARSRSPRPRSRYSRSRYYR
jgi:hypothetical protein